MRLDHILSGQHDTLIESEYQFAEKKRRDRVNERVKKRAQLDIAFRVSRNLRSRLKNALKAKQAKKAAIDLIGCSQLDLILHLESQFTEGMTWSNYGEWHIDHIKPCASFDLLKEEEQRKCFHYTNLQPLWAQDNRRKSCKT